VRFLESHQAEIEATGLPTNIFRNEHRLIEFLSQGNVDDDALELKTISDEEFQRLEVIVNAYFLDGWEQASWPVFSSERLRRFGRYG